MNGSYFTGECRNHKRTRPCHHPPGGVSGSQILMTRHRGLRIRLLNLLCQLRRHYKRNKRGTSTRKGPNLFLSCHHPVLSLGGSGSRRLHQYSHPLSRRWWSQQARPAQSQTRSPSHLFVRISINRLPLSSSRRRSWIARRRPFQRHSLGNISSRRRPNRQRHLRRRFLRLRPRERLCTSQRSFSITNSVERRECHRLMLRSLP